MMLCGSFLGLLLSRGFATHNLRPSEMSEICGTVQVAKKVERSKVDFLPPLSEGIEGSTQEVYPYLGYAGSGPTERNWLGFQAESQGSGGESSLYSDSHDDTVASKPCIMRPLQGLGKMVFGLFIKSLPNQ